MDITFVLPGEEENLAALRRLDPDRDWREFQLGERVWLLQTYLRLVRAGCPAELASSPPAEGIVVFHGKHARGLRACWRRLRRAVLLGVRADYPEPLLADFQVLQNSRYADGKRRFFVPHWPQPALIPRDGARGTAIRRIAFKGFEQNLHPDFRAPEWREFLAGLGVEWEVDAVPWAGAATDLLSTQWPDFREVDLVLAVRRPNPRLWTQKPATKLINAWLAGAPALVGPEYACRELRRTELDYLEVGSLAEAKAAVLRLRERPDLYREMVENGRIRGAEFTTERILERWLELLTERIPILAASRSVMPLPVRMAGRWLVRTAARRPVR